MNKLRQRLPCLIMAAAMLLSICVFSALDSSGSEIGKGRLNIVATTTMLADLSQEIGGDFVSVQGLMGCGVDPHQYQASAGDVIKMQEADVVVYSGLHLEGKMGDVFEALEGRGKTVICASDGIDPQQLIRSENGSADPHIWFDVKLWEQAAVYLAKRLSEADPENSEGYERNLYKYIEKLESLDRYIKEQTDRIPEEKRVLITAHDAFGYFGKAYGYQVMGLQGISTSTEAGTADVSALADVIAERKIPAVFVESSVPLKGLEALMAAVEARGFSVSLGGTLYSDSLGDEKTGTNGYTEAFTSNIDTIVKALYS